MLKKIILGLLILVVLAVGGVTVYLNMIDWNQHKAVIAKQFSEATGKEVSFDGAVSFNLFPSPYLEATDINMYNVNAEGQRMVLAKIKKLVAQLSLNSLIRGRFNVDKMTIVNPEIFVELLDEGELNWASNKVENQDFAVSNVDVSFGSVMLEDAKVHFVSKKYDFHVVADGVKAEIIAGSIFGPYRIEGSYVKGDVPGGFALDLGKFSDSFATSINAVLSHPQSESYARFDGTVLLKNDAVNGNITVESKKPVDFLNSTFEKINLPETYEHPLAMSLALKSDKSQITLSNVVIKYDKSAGAGNILIPRLEEKIGDEETERRRVDVAFNMAEFDIVPLINVMKDFWKQFDGKDYIPETEFDVIADLKSVKTYYKDQVIRDLDLSVDFVDNVFTLRKFAVRLPFDGVAKAKGELFSVEKVLTYNFDVEAETTEFAKTAQWLGYDVKPLSSQLYKKASTKFTISGTPQTVKISPFVFNVDKIGINGKLGIVRGDVDKYFVIAEADNINFDNYVENMPEDVAEGKIDEQIRYRFGKLAALKDVDGQFRLTLNSGIWGQIPFEKLYAEGALKEGVLKFKELSVGEMASAQMMFKGAVLGFGGEPEVKNLSYDIDVKDMTAFTERMKIKMPSVDLKNLSKFSSEGVISGMLSRVALKSSSKFGDIDFSYDGEIARNEDNFEFGGKLDLRSNDFVRMLNNFSVNYHPEYPLGLFKITTDVRGNKNTVLLKNADANIGSNNFKGELLYSVNGSNKQLKTNLNINNIELEKFFYNTGAKAEVSSFRSKGEKVPFLSKPVLSKANINYDWLKNWDVEAKVVAGKLSLYGEALSNASWGMKLNKQVLKIIEFKADDGEGAVSGDIELNIPNKNALSGKMGLYNIDLNQEKWNGLNYGLKKGVLTADFSFNTGATSVDELLTQFSGKGTFTINKPLVKGWDLETIETDLDSRATTDGLKMMLQENLSRGETAFDIFEGAFEVNNGNYRIYNTSFVSDVYNVGAVAQGNFGDWTQTAKFQVSFKENQSLSGFGFSLDGATNAPSLDVDIEALSDMYISREKEMIAEAKAAENAKVEKYRALMGLQQEYVEKSRIKLDEAIVPDFEACSARAEDEKMKVAYARIGEEIKLIETEIKDIKAQKNMAVVTDDVIADLQKRNDILVDKIKKLALDLKVLRAQDVRLRVKDYYAKVSERAGQVQEAYSKYADANGDFGNRLAAFNAQYSLEQDPKARAIRQKLDRLMSEVDTLKRQVERDNIAAKNVDDVALLEGYATSFAEAYHHIDKNIEEMKSSIDEYVQYVEATISAEEKAYYKKIHDEKAKQKITENVGTIATSDGRTVTIRRNLEEIERTEELIKQEGRRVLDFSND